MQIYVNGIIFCETDISLCKEFSNCTSEELKMSIKQGLKFFLEFQIKWTNNGIFISQTNYIMNMLKKFEMEESNPMNTPMSSSINLDKEDQCIFTYI